MEEALRGEYVERPPRPSPGWADHNLMDQQTTRRVSGFTLVELLIVIAVLTIIASATITYTFDATSDARAASAAQDLQSIARAATHYHSYHARWPGPTYGGNAPGDFQHFLNRETFTRVASVAADDRGRYGWFAWRDHFAAAYVTYVDADDALKVDALIDDGNARSGYVRVYEWTAPVGTVATIALWLRFPGR